MHHPVFTTFKRFQGVVPPGYHANFLGVMTRNGFAAGMITALGHQLPEPGYAQADYPTFSEEYFEWVDLLEAVLDARGEFTMIELGAGYGRWLVNAWAAVKQQRSDLQVKFLGVEAEPTHFAWLKQHFEDNGLDPAEHRLIEAAIDAQDGVVNFYVGKPDEWYGQRIADAGDTEREVNSVKAVTLKGLLADLESVDLIDLDIEGTELTVLTSAIEELDRKVKRIHIGTHARSTESNLRALFHEHGWYKRNDYEVGSTELTPWGPISFNNGVQTWINPRRARVEATPGEVDWLQWAMRSSDVRHSRLQDGHSRLQDEMHTLQATYELRLQAALQAAQEARNAAQQGRDRIAAMESSKFWKLRRLWFGLKRAVGLGAGE